jgi:hypothetical protein
MTKKPDPGVWIAALSGAAVIGAVVAGLLAVRSPGEARALRLDARRIGQMEAIAAAAQCAYTFTGRVPANVDEIRADLRDRRRAVGACRNVELGDRPNSISYAADGAEHIKLCGAFSRPSPPSREPTGRRFFGVADFPELDERRTSAGQHCFRIRLVDQTQRP